MKFWKKFKSDPKPDNDEKGFIYRWEKRFYSFFGSSKKKKKIGKQAEDFDNLQEVQVSRPVKVQRGLRHGSSMNELDSAGGSISRSRRGTRPRSGTWSDYTNIKTKIDNNTEPKLKKKYSKVYDINGPRDFLMINISKYDQGNQRKGSIKDMKLLREAFSKRKFELHSMLTDHVTSRDVDRLFDSYVKSKRSPKIVALAVMAHGTDDYCIKFSDGELNPIYKALEPLFNCPELHNVPKIVVCQFCRGESMIHTCFELDAVDAIENIQPAFNSQTDTMYFFPTSVGSPAIRDPMNGSPFIKEFCRVFCEENDVYDMFLELNDSLAEKEFPVKYGGEPGTLKPAPMINSSFRKKLIFENCEHE